MEIFETPLFEGMKEAEYREMLACGCTREKRARRGKVLYHAGSITHTFGILLSGCVHVAHTDLWGNRMILHSIAPGESFAETYAICRAPMMVEVTAAEDSRVLLVDLEVLMAEGNRRKSWYQTLLGRLLFLSTGKNLAWSSRFFCISAKSARDRILHYLSAESLRQGSREVVIPFDRQQMADYLNLERTALSKELGRMQKEGLLTFRKNRFCLTSPDETPRG